MASLIDALLQGNTSTCMSPDRKNSHEICLKEYLKSFFRDTNYKVRYV